MHAPGRHAASAADLLLPAVASGREWVVDDAPAAAGMERAQAPPAVAGGAGARHRRNVSVESTGTLDGTEERVSPHQHRHFWRRFNRDKREWDAFWDEGAKGGERGGESGAASAAAAATAGTRSRGSPPAPPRPARAPDVLPACLPWPCPSACAVGVPEHEDPAPHAGAFRLVHLAAHLLREWLLAVTVLLLVLLLRECVGGCWGRAGGGGVDGRAVQL